MKDEKIFNHQTSVFSLPFDNFVNRCPPKRDLGIGGRDDFVDPPILVQFFLRDVGFDGPRHMPNLPPQPAEEAFARRGWIRFRHIAC
jgi:hypothetical protein